VLSDKVRWPPEESLTDFNRAFFAFLISGNNNLPFLPSYDVWSVFWGSRGTRQFGLDWPELPPQVE